MRRQAAAPAETARVSGRAADVMMPTRRPFWQRVGVMSLAHFANDLSAAYLGPLLPLVVTKFSLSLTLAGLLGTVFSISSALGQPLFGLASDRLTRPVFAFVGPLLTTVMMGLLGVAPSYGVMVGLLVLAGIGTAAFHPQAFGLAGALSEDRRGAGLSIFVAGGEFGYSLGPVFVAALVATLGLPGTMVAALPGLVACAVVWWTIREWQVVRAPAAGGLRGDVRQHGRAFALIWFIVVARSVIILAHITFIPLLLREQGESLILGGTAVFMFGGIGTIGGLVGGTLSDRIGRRAVLAISMAASAPLLLLFGRLSGALALLPLALGGFTMFLGAPVAIVMAQEMVPHRASLASSVVTGLAWGTAGLSLTLIGAAADRIGLAPTLALTLVLALPALAATWALPAHPAED
ncbi:MAG: MFS transporter [Armatimonadota bacterium]|nr:MFS transporter [Armatimonadota bacterium]